MGAKYIVEPQLYCEDSFGNFTCIVKEGDRVRIKIVSGREIYGRIDSIEEKIITIEDSDCESHEISIKAIDEVLNDEGK